MEDWLSRNIALILGKTFVQINLAEVWSDRAPFPVEQFTAALQATTTLIFLRINFDGFESTPESNRTRRVLEPLCRCIANLRRRSQNHPLRGLMIKGADKVNGVDQFLVAAKQCGIPDLTIFDSRLPIQSLVEFCRDNHHLKVLTVYTSTLFDDDSTITVSPQDSSVIMALDSLDMDNVSFENSSVETTFLNVIAHVTYPILALGEIIVGGDNDEERKKIARMRIVSELIKPSVEELILYSGCPIENIDVIEACTTVTQIRLLQCELPHTYRPEAVQQKLQAITTRNRELARFVANPHDFPGGDLLALMHQFDNISTGRYKLAQGFARILSTQGLATPLTNGGTLRTSISSATTTIGTWRSKLFTRGDPFHLHKCLGLLCLCSFALRLSRIGDNDMAFRSHPELTVVTVLMHSLLNVTSFAFALPQQRIKEGTRIWPESRLHTLCFVSRSLATILWAWYETHVLVPPRPYFWVNTLIVLGNLLAVDYGSSTVQYKSHAIRDARGPAPLKFFASMMQFWATAHCLMGFRARVSIQFYAVFIMQITAFITTLRRKNLIRHSTVIVLYMLQLVVAIPLGRTLVDQTLHPVLYEQFMTNRNATFLVGNTAAMLRMIGITTTTAKRTTSSWRLWLQRKYIVWMLMSLWCIELRKTVYGTEHDDDDDDDDASWWTRTQLEQATAASFLALLVFGFYQVTYGYYAHLTASVRNRTATNTKQE